MKVELLLEATDKASAPVKALQKSVAGFNGAATRGAKQATAGYDKTAKAIDRTNKATAAANKAAAAYNTSTMKGTARAALSHAQTVKAVSTVARATEQATRAAERQTRSVQTSARAQADAAIAAGRAAAAQDSATAAAARASRQAERAARLQAQQERVARRGRALERLAEHRGRQFGGGLRQAGGGMARAGQGLAAGSRAAAGVATGAGVLGVGAGIVMSQLVAPAGSFEQYQSTLETVTNSSEKARQSMQWISAFAAKTPYDLDGVTEAFVTMKARGFDPTNGSLKTLGDAASAMNKPVLQAVEALADAATGENERLKEFGIVASKVGREFQYVYTDAATGQQRMFRALAGDRAGMTNAILQIFAANYDGAMERQAQTWNGMVSNLGDTWSRVSLMVMDAGLFDWMKGRLSEFLATVDRMAADGSLRQWAAEVSQGLQRAMEIAWEFGKGLVGAFKIILPWMELAASWMGGWDNLALGFIALPFLPALLGIAAGFAQIAGGVAIASLAFIRILGVMRTAGMFTSIWQGLVWVFRLLAAPLGLAVRGVVALGAAFMATPIGWVVAGIAAVAGAAYLIYDNWGSIGPWFGRQWDAITGWISDAWATISGFDWGALVPDMDWAAMIPDLSWSDVLTVIDWASWVMPIRWLDLIPGFSWANVIPQINWQSWFTFSWADVLPDFEWSSIIPSMPDFGSWFGGGTEALAAALPNDPAALERMAAASGRIAEHTAAIAAVDASAALAGVNGVSEAATRATALAQAIIPAAGQAMAQARAVMSGVSFQAEGMALMSTLAAGIRAGAGQAVAAVRGVAQSMRDYLPHSPAKTGPLSDLHRVRFSETLASAIRPGPAVAAVSAVAAGMMGAVPASMSGLAMGAPAMAGPALSAPVSAGAGQMAGVTVHAPLNVTINGSAPDAMGDFERLLREHAATIERIVGDAAHGRARLEY